jgi:hypothetical protein
MTNWCQRKSLPKTAFWLSLLMLIGIMAAGYTAGIDAAEIPDSTTAVDRVEAGKGVDAAPIAVPEPSRETLEYYRSGNVLWVAATLWGFLVPAAIFFSGLSARLRDWAQAVGRGWFFTIAVYVLLYLTLVYLLDLPLNWYERYVRAHAYGLSNQTLGQWFGDSLKALAVPW